MHILLIFYFSLPHIFSFIFFFYYFIFTIIYFVLPRGLSLQVLEANVYFERSRPISLRAVEVIIYFARPRSISLPALEVIIYFARGRWVNWVQPLPCRLFHYCTFVLKYRRTLSSFRQSPQKSLRYPMIDHISLLLFPLKKNTIRSPSIIRVGGKEEMEGKKKPIEEDRKSVV